MTPLKPGRTFISNSQIIRDAKPILDINHFIKWAGIVYPVGEKVGVCDRCKAKFELTDPQTSLRYCKDCQPRRFYQRHCHRDPYFVWASNL